MRGGRPDPWIGRAGEWAVYALGRSFAFVTAPVPLWPLEGAIAGLCERLVLLVPAFRQRAERNLDLVRPGMAPEARRRLVRAAAGHFARLMMEYARFDRFIREVRVESEGIDRVKAAAAGRGAILVTAHYGNWEAARIALTRAGLDCGLIYRAFNNRYVDRRAMEVIPAAGSPVVQKGPAGMRRLMAEAVRGGLMMVLVDQRNTGAPMIDFLGQPAETVTIVAELASRAGIPLIPVVARRNVAGRRFDVTFEAPVPPGEPEAMMAEVNRRIGAWIEADPDQWLWFHNRWKTKREARRNGADRRRARSRAGG